MATIPLIPSYPFTYSDELKNRFDVYEFFYNIQKEKYRSCLEIVRKDSCAESSRLIRQTPDAIVAMMNPGFSRPWAKDFEPHVVSSFAEADELLLKGRLIPTHPDPTQYQVERIMVKMNWKYVRVINLADLREAKSNLFVKSIRPKIKSYSIFSSARRSTLDSDMASILKLSNELRIHILGVIDKRLVGKIGSLHNLSDEDDEQQKLDVELIAMIKKGIEESL